MELEEIKISKKLFNDFNPTSSNSLASPNPITKHLEKVNICADTQKIEVVTAKGDSAASHHYWW